MMPGMRPTSGLLPSPSTPIALPLLALALAATSTAGCGGSSYSYPQAVESSAGYDTATVTTGSVAVAEGAPAADMGGMGGGGGDVDYRFEDEAEGTRSDVLTPAREQYAQNVPAPQGGEGQQQGQAQGQAQTQTQTDAVDLSGPLLIYMAEIHLAVYEVDAKQDAILAAVTEMGGFLAQRTDDMLVVRVPAARYRDALAVVEATGDVLHRNVQVLDVGEEFRDNAIRIRNAEQMRDRLAQLLTRANDVEAALAIERELGRLTDEIERLKGRQRYLADRISFSTITVRFQPLSTEPAAGADGFVLPFPWLNELGLTNLMRLQ
jgi:hypothetical protein